MRVCANINGLSFNRGNFGNVTHTIDLDGKKFFCVTLDCGKQVGPIAAEHWDVIGKTYDKWIARALQEPTKIKAMSYACTIENDRVLRVALERNSLCVDTCFEFLLREVDRAWDAREAHGIVKDSV